MDLDLDHSSQQQPYFDESLSSDGDALLVRVKIHLSSSAQLDGVDLSGDAAFHRLVRFCVAFLDGQDVGTWPEGGPGLSEDAKFVLSKIKTPGWADRCRWLQEPSFFGVTHTIWLPRTSASRSSFASGSSARSSIRRFAKEWINEVSKER